MNTFELSPSQPKRGQPQTDSSGDLGAAFLLHNTRWFTQIRWMVIATLTVVGLAAHLVPQTFSSLGIQPPRVWLLQLAAAAAALNVLFCLAARRLGPDSPHIALRVQLWMQILVDLLAVTVLVHKVGSVDTFIAFTYLFHIVLACIFFSRRESLLVTVVATGMYLACVALEISGPGRGPHILVDLSPMHEATPRTAILMATSAVFVWFVVWYFAATLSRDVRQRDAKLQAANAQLLEADEEKNRMVLRTVHDLKAPFAGIESSVQRLQNELWDQTPPPVQETVLKIAHRAHTLRDRIRDILMLGDLRSGRARPLPPSRIDFQPWFAELAALLAETAGSRRVSVDLSGVPSVTLVTQKERLAILFSNILANAISYSHEGGTVEVSGVVQRDAVRVRIADHGIGIEEDVLPRIFEEYYRTTEAAAFNRASTGLGLAIVQEVASQLGLGISVTSEHGKGTTFEVRIPHMEADNEEAGG